MIPKIIHYCWFGGNEMPKTAKTYIQGWKQRMPDYQFIEWNEKNYDISKCKFAEDAYYEKKWAFVTDYVRLDVVYEYGGIYLDTDVEVLRPFDDLLVHKGFMGFDDDNMINTGLGFGAEKGNPFIGENKAKYESLNLYDYIKNLDQISCPHITSDLVKLHGGKLDNKLQEVGNLMLYPREYFCPMNFYNGKIKITDRTYSVHRYSMSWLTARDRRYHKIEMCLSNLLGRKIARLFVALVKFPGSFREKAGEYGFREALDYYRKRL